MYLKIAEKQKKGLFKMKKKFFIFLLALTCIILVIFFFNIKQFNPLKPIENLVTPTPTEVLPNPVVIIQEMHQLAKLETVSMPIETQIWVERDDKRAWGIFGEKILFIAYGQAIAGVDLSQIQSTDIQVIDKDTIKVHLPEAEIFNVIMDNKNSYVADRQEGIFASISPQLETSTRKYAQEELEKAAGSSNILTKANQNAQDYIESFLFQLSFKNVKFQ
jgi:hypothetical protein